MKKSKPKAKTAPSPQPSFNRGEAIAIGECLRQAYVDSGIPVVAVPFMTVAERTSLVIRELSLTDPKS